MTKREMLEMVAQGNITEDVKAQAQAMLDAMDAEKTKRAEKQAEKADTVYAPYIEKFISALTNEPKTATDILAVFEGETAPSGKPVTVQFVSSLGKKVVDKGAAIKVDVKVSGKGTCKGYQLAE